MDGKHAADGQDIPKHVFVAALDALNDLLKGLGHTMTFLCVGGGAMTLAYGARGKTQDLDGILYPDNDHQVGLLQTFAAEIAEDFRASGKFPLEDTWINVQVRPIMKDQGYRLSDFEASAGYEWSNMKLLFATPGYLLAMKCQSLRPQSKDYQDVVVLLRRLRIKTMSGLEAEIGDRIQWNDLGNTDYWALKLAIAFAFPGQTEYEEMRQKALAMYQEKKQRGPSTDQS